jgi:membrane-associated phospholipid phosphatase
MIAAYFLVSVVAWAVYVAVPVRMDYPELVCGGISCRVLEGLYRVDGGVNVMPSLHAAHSVLAAAIFFTYRTYRSGLAWVVALAAAAVCVAAVMTRQHYILDVPPGILLGLVGWLVVRWVGNAARRLWPAPAATP